MTDHHPVPTDVDALIVGGGPAGLTAALVLGRQQRRVLLADSGHPRNEHASRMHMYLGRDGTDPARLRRDAHAEIAVHPAVRCVDVEVSRLEGTAGDFTAELGDRSVRARTVLLAGGVRDELTPLPGLAERWGRDVHHCAYCHGFETLGRRIGVLARIPVDVVLARYVRDRFGSHVTLYTAGLDAEDEFTAEALSAARGEGIAVDAREVSGLGGAPGSPRVEFADGGAEELEAIYHRPAAVQSNDLAAGLGCTMTADGLIEVGPDSATSVEGVYAAGDAARMAAAPAPMQFVASAVADGQRAAVWMEQQLFTRS
ncbi:thioredoxin reductase [Brevibacterium sanguinis]|uniref:Thioredoxin reductase n=2 Tax=Brevibacterium TaxID=1696 RepID=A0A366IH70_9MICO|nr:MULTISPECIES: NAD(P)/FAD-dependent oxidoreductase [Brevibacterium]RBP64939.1 thioredoxin reductase [Brevibacterium sanguinis]RBP71202.1 thioredoxin reductase [Brevibacterium celere]